MKGSCLNKCQNVLKFIFSLNINVNLRRVQHCLVSMLEKSKSATDHKKSFGAPLTDFSKAFDCLSHDLLIAKLNAHGFNMSALQFEHSYRKSQMQSTKVNSKNNSWEEMITADSQGSVLDPLLFNIFLCDLFLIMENCNLCR